MQKYKSISSLWNVMLKEQATGLVKRLLPSNTPIKVFATYRHSDEVCGIAFSGCEITAFRGKRNRFQIIRLRHFLFCSTIPVEQNRKFHY